MITIKGRPIPITNKEGWSLQMIFNHYVDEIIQSYKRYKMTFKKKTNRNLEQKK
ncbi:MAG TPA: hypothetical protein VJH88_01580 [Candidatus Nanoarchaeia archaeon]|nr:hypothetical protein [Candidatus Nanoarchaeia archaeon]